MSRTRADALDVSDVDAQIVALANVEGTARRLLDQRRRAFAQGYVAALEDPDGAVWLDYFKERAR